MKLSQVLNDFNVFVDGEGYAGVANKATIPEVVFESIEKSQAGWAGTTEILTGQVGKLEASIQVDTFAAPRLFKLVGDNSARNTPIILRGDLADAGSNKPLKITMQGVWKSVGMGEFTKKTEVANTFKITLDKLVVESDGEELVYINISTYDIRIQGNDLGKRIKANLGL